MVYKHNTKAEEYTPIWVKLVGGFIAAGIGGIIGLILSWHMLVWYIDSCEYNNDCIAYQLMQKL